MIDQTQLPCKQLYPDTASIDEVWTAIRLLQVRGAPAIGIAAAMGIVAAVQNAQTRDRRAFLRQVHRAADYLATARPTAVNLFWALDRMKRVADENAGLLPVNLKDILAKEAVKIRDEDAAMCRAIGEHGARLLKNGWTVLTHCNAGGLATSEFGTALAPIYVASEQGKSIRVFADETRPLLQGARLTVWELMRAGIDVTLICDNMAAQVMKEGRIDAVLVGADGLPPTVIPRTRSHIRRCAPRARPSHPILRACPSSTIDLKTPDGSKIPIEEGAGRSHKGFWKGNGSTRRQSLLASVRRYARGIDRAIVCEKGIIRPSKSGKFDLKKQLGRSRKSRS